ncbi:MAG: hypothetical protein IH881_20040, partial [Myxococcales bacterium]|nr:hypothetical protein [Myxococcales bacterium]
MPSNYEQRTKGRTRWSPGVPQLGDHRLPLRLWNKVKVSESGCWDWQGQLDRAGYGRCFYQGKGGAAHRAFFMALVKQIPGWLDPDTKLVPSHHVGKRTVIDAKIFVAGIAKRIEGRPQISTDKLGAYRSAILGQWSERDEKGWTRPDWGTIVKRYEVETAAAGRYSPPHVVAADKRVESGNPDVSRISTSHVERQNLTMRMNIRRFTRLTNGFSKKVENLQAAVSLHFAHYNFVRKHITIKTVP